MATYICDRCFRYAGGPRCDKWGGGPARQHLTFTGNHPLQVLTRLAGVGLAGLVIMASINPLLAMVTAVLAGGIQAVRTRPDD